MYNLTQNQERKIELLVDEHNWILSNNVEDAEERLDMIYIEADDMAEELGVDRAEFWNNYFN